jgi:hypothetical protein
MRRIVSIVGAALMGTAAGSWAQEAPTAVPPKEPYSVNQQRKATELSGKIKSVDRKSHSLTISAASGGQESIKLADSARITRDGIKVGLDKLEPGDEVRASFDPITNLATSVKVRANRLNKTK